MAILRKVADRSSFCGKILKVNVTRRLRRLHKVRGTLAGQNEFLVTKVLFCNKALSDHTPLQREDDFGTYYKEDLILCLWFVNICSYVWLSRAIAIVALRSYKDGVSFWSLTTAKFTNGLIMKMKCGTKIYSVAIEKSKKNEKVQDNMVKLTCEKNFAICNKIQSRDCSQRHTLSSCAVHIRFGDVCAVIPKFNMSGHGNFKIKIIEDLSNISILGKTCVSPVVYMEPHGSKFFTSYPAIIYLPVHVKLKTSDNVICLCSNTKLGEKLHWKPINPGDYELSESYIKIKTSHFSFYTAIVNKGYPEVSAMIYAGEGGTLDIPYIPGLEVNFPASAIHYDIEATMKVLFADKPYDVDHDDPASYALAAPVIKLGPTGHLFNHHSKEKVQVRLPLPNAREIFENCDRPFLTFWKSSTAEGQPLEWELFDADYKIDVDDDGGYSVCFPVDHFTFFKALWSVFDSALYGAKIGASFFYPYFNFCITVQAFISLNENTRTFGLCILCYRVGEPLQNVGNFPVFVGSSGPRMVPSGLLCIRVVSNIFEANTDFGEEMLQQQEYFIGRPFDKQFACKYISTNFPVSGPIGKVYIEEVKNDGNVKPLFDFLLNKPQPGQEMPQPQNDNNGAQGSREEKNETWETQLSKELATLLNIKTDCDLEDGVWEDIARNLGYTQLEIDMKFKGEGDPLMRLLEDYKKRGGSANEFISAMYKIGRKENIYQFEQKWKQVLPDHDGAKNSSLSPSRSSSTSGIVLPPAHNNRKRRHSIENSSQVSVPPGKLIEIAKEKTVQEKWKNLGRALGVDDNQLLEIERNYDNDGIQEKAYQMLLAWQERYPDQGSDELIIALGKWHLNNVARLLYF